MYDYTHNHIIAVVCESLIKTINELLQSLNEVESSKAIMSACESLDIHHKPNKMDMLRLAQEYQRIKTMISEPRIFFNTRLTNDLLVALLSRLQSKLNDIARLINHFHQQMKTMNPLREIEVKVFEVKRIIRMVDRAPYPEQYPSLRSPAELHEKIYQLQNCINIDFSLFESKQQAQWTQALQAINDNILVITSSTTLNKKYSSSQQLKTQLKPFQCSTARRCVNIKNAHNLLSDATAKIVSQLSRHEQSLYIYRSVIMKSSHRGTPATARTKNISDWSQVDGYIPPDCRVNDESLTLDEIDNIRKKNRHWFNPAPQEQPASETHPSPSMWMIKSPPC